MSEKKGLDKGEKEEKGDGAGAGVCVERVDPYFLGWFLLWQGIVTAYNNHTDYSPYKPLTLENQNGRSCFKGSG